MKEGKGRKELEGEGKKGIGRGREEVKGKERKERKLSRYQQTNTFRLLSASSKLIIPD